MTFSDYFKMAIHQCKRNLLRSTLTVIGIVIGIAAMITVFTVGDAGESKINEELNQFGINRLFIMPNDSGTSVNVLKIDDVELLFNEVKSIKSICPEAYRRGTMIYNGKRVVTDIIGTTSEIEDIEDKKMVYGRFLSENDILYERKVIVIPEDVSEDLFGDKNPCGDKVKIGGVNFTVIGIEKNTTPIYSSIVSQRSSMPITVFQKVFNVSQLSDISVTVSDSDEVNKAVNECISVMVNKYGSGSVKIINLTSEIERAQNIINIFKLIISAIALISLLVGGIGIMNIMLVTVTERTKEIGIRKALGATKMVILRQFLVESLFYAFIGGIIGIGFGLLFSQIAGIFIGIDISFDLSPIILSFLFAGAVGVFFGIFPAYKAAKLNPVDALRQE